MTLSALLLNVGHHLGGFTFVASVLLLLVPLCGVLGGILGSWMVASRNVYINSITAQRSQWLEKLRTSVASFEAAVDTWNLRKNSLDTIAATGETPTVGLTNNEFYSENERMTLLANTIHLQLNPDGPIDQNILALVDSISKCRNTGGRQMVAATTLLTAHAQWLLKAEWEKVKWEAGGVFYRLRHWSDDSKREKAYQAFEDGHGAPAPIIAAMNKIVDDWQPQNMPSAPLRDP